ncbi:MAG: Nuclear import receptor [Phylliscum demangeonii]|nr:MAG: Nuclear import receptor [Phylliscum demangeonii]
MASNGDSAQVSFAPVLAALNTLQSREDQATKEAAHNFLDAFQKSPEAWTTTYGILQSADATVEAKLFAATTLRGKITYDLDQLPRETLIGLRDSLISALAGYSSGPRPIRTQLCVCLANLAIQMSEWKDVLQTVISAIGGSDESGACVLEFIKILPEEVIEGRKIILTEDALAVRTRELLEENAAQVLQLLTQYAQSSSTNPQLLGCITSWLREVPLSDVVESPLLAVIMDGLSAEPSFEAAVDCLCTMFKETREVDEYQSVIEKLYPRIISLRPRIAVIASTEDVDAYKGITRLFAEAGEAWVILIARMPQTFRSLVECVLECTARDQSREAVALTFNFWYEMKNYLVLDKYVEARQQFANVFNDLVDIMIEHLQYPVPESGNEDDLFDGDKEQEEKFRENRHLMGDVLKDCCVVLGATECLGKSFKVIQRWVSTYGASVTESKVPHWQGLEAPLFSLRAMGRMVPMDESIILPQLMPLLVQVPSQVKVRFAAIMAIGRYTEWTAEHPPYLEPQLNFIISAFDSKTSQIMQAGALALRFFCQDCKDLLRDHVQQLQTFYDSVLDSLPSESREEITEGVANVVSAQPVDKIYEIMKLYCDPLMKRLMAAANEASDDHGKLAVAGHLQLLTLFIQGVTPSVHPAEENPAVKYCQEVFPILSALVDNFLDYPAICECVCRCWRTMVFSYRVAIQPLLPAMAEKVVSCFAASRQGCFLWTTDAIVREFAEGAEYVDEATSNAVYRILEEQVVAMLRALNDVPPGDLPDVIEDFFRLLTDALLYYPNQLIPSALLSPIFSAALTALTLQQTDPLIATLCFLRDLLGYGGDDAPRSGDTPIAPEIQQLVQKVVMADGETLVQRCLTGMMFTFPRDCFPDASGVLMEVVNLMPSQFSVWIAKTIEILPAGTVSQAEAQGLMNQINLRMAEGEVRKVRYLLQDFTNSYRRRNVTPRDGLGRLEAARFRFSG